MSDIPDAAITLIQRYEGLRLETYRDAGRGIETIGYGHTAAAGPPVPTIGMKITKEAAEWLLYGDVKNVGARLHPLIDVELTENQWAALLSFAFNEGVPAFETSTLRTLVNYGQFSAVPAELAKWNKATVNGRKRVLPGLVARREAEAELWSKP